MTRFMPGLGGWREEKSYSTVCGSRISAGQLMVKQPYEAPGCLAEKPKLVAVIKNLSIQIMIKTQNPSKEIARD